MIHFRRHYIAAIAPAALIAAFATAAEPTFPNLVYGYVGNTPMRLDLYLPAETSEPVPVVINIHGGGWFVGDRYPLPDFVTPLIDEGFAVASVQYRLTNQGWMFPGNSVTFPGQIHDVKGAVRWLRANADLYGLDADNIGAWGASAGGSLAALLGTSGDVAELEGDVGGNLQHSSRVKAVADYYGATDLLYMQLDITWPPGGIDHDSHTSAESKYVGWAEPGQGIGDIRFNEENPAPPYPDLVNLCLDANSITHVTPDDAAFFIAHGDQDTIIPLAQSTKLADALSSAGVPHELKVIAGASHDSGLGAEVDEGAIAFFQAHLMPSVPTRTGDLDGDGDVDFDDFTALLSAWGPCPAPPTGCPADLDADGQVDFDDFVTLLSNWG